jgi:methylated-DNA-protein-cysteine methyltransferase related protein
MNAFELPKPIRDAFYTAVWDIARQIPSGKVSTYGQIASFIPIPNGVTETDYQAYRARWAGSAMNACPADVPWQRVINAQGKIALRSGAERQRQLLEAEGVTFDNRDRVDMVRFAWEGPPAEWLRARNLIIPEVKPTYKEQSLW